ncbi:MAG: sigma-70 family RNA polymerase sigma factor [Candidatus Heimdallarchaeota archaeon]|nr:MAG: sigma-70 family RNA polymerase sigma factor [Candidatus Heimdallarchaeota archaeon]
MDNSDILEQAYPIIKKIADIRSKRGAFAYYDKEDIAQEVWYMCLDALDRYDDKIGPLENYLVKHVANRLKNLKRDKYYRPGFNIQTSGLARTRMNLVNALSLIDNRTTAEGTLLGSSSVNVNPIDNIICDETIDCLFSNIPSELCKYMEDLIGNNDIDNSMIDNVRLVVSGILYKKDNSV